MTSEQILDLLPPELTTQITYSCYGSQHGTIPKNDGDWWIKKLNQNGEGVIVRIMSCRNVDGSRPHIGV